MDQKVSVAEPIYSLLLGLVTISLAFNDISSGFLLSGMVCLLVVIFHLVLYVDLLSSHSRHRKDSDIYIVVCYGLPESFDIVQNSPFGTRGHAYFYFQVKGSKLKMFTDFISQSS